MITNANAALLTAAAKLLNDHQNLTVDQALELTRATLATSTPAPVAAEGRPVAPQLNIPPNASPATRLAAAIAHEKALEEWIPRAQSYQEPLSQAAQEAHAQLESMRAQAAADSDAEKLRRADEMERLMEIVIAGGAR
jgi:hypothetical protein